MGWEMIAGKLRKVRCDAQSPSCGACRRTAKFEGRDLDSVVCHYAAKRESKAAVASTTTTSKGKTRPVKKKHLVAATTTRMKREHEEDQEQEQQQQDRSVRASRNTANPPIIKAAQQQQPPPPPPTIPSRGMHVYHLDTRMRASHSFSSLSLFSPKSNHANLFAFPNEQTKPIVQHRKPTLRRQHLCSPHPLRPPTTTGLRSQLCLRRTLSPRIPPPELSSLPQSLQPLLPLRPSEVKPHQQCHRQYSSSKRKRRKKKR